MSIAETLGLESSSRPSRQRETEQWIQRCTEQPQAMGIFIQNLLQQQREQNVLINWQAQLIEQLKAQAGYQNED
jgi:hypothetical protein